MMGIFFLGLVVGLVLGAGLVLVSAPWVMTGEAVKSRTGPSRDEILRVVRNLRELDALRASMGLPPGRYDGR
jgi:hypothetical protein